MINSSNIKNDAQQFNSYVLAALPCLFSKVLNIFQLDQFGDFSLILVCLTVGTFNSCRMEDAFVNIAGVVLIFL